jgi:hypothetical protein
MRVADTGSRFGLGPCQLPLEVALIMLGGVNDIHGRFGQLPCFVHDEEFFFDPERQAIP